MIRDFSQIVRREGDLIVLRLDQADKMKYLQLGDIVELNFDDGRKITSLQRKKCYAMLGDIDYWMGNGDIELTKYQLKYLFCTNNGIYGRFSLSDCSESDAELFINFLINFCLKENVEFASKTLDQIQGQYGWNRYCLKYRRCCICGQQADIAHVHAVGIGRNRKKINHVGNYVMPLCRKHHMEQHRVGIKTFMKENQIKGVKVAPDIAAMLKLGDWQIYRGEQVVVTKDD